MQAIREGMLAHTVLVRRLLAIDEVGRLFPPHRNTAAALARVPDKTVGRWLWQARDVPDAPTPATRAGWFLKAPAWDDPAWARMEALVREGYELRTRRQRGPRPTADLNAPLYRARRSPNDERGNPGRDAETGVDLLVPEADVVVTEALDRTASDIRHVAAAGGVMCLDGEPGSGKTVALQYALSRLPAGPVVRRIPVPVGATVAHLRYAVADALALTVRYANQRSDTDRKLTAALRTPHLLVLDDAQRLSAPCLEYLCRLVQDPDAPTALVLAGTVGTEAVRRVPELASRVLARCRIPSLTLTQALDVLPTFHPLWARIPPRELARTDDRGTRGNFRTYAQLTAHIIDTVLTDPLACSGSALLDRAWRRLTGL
ncbi:ATP-binding protein [Kitasatospora purpeofusca]|uniref:ATP-binding protein n=1 Tax=Kitasatospora purpeofusca TaxID=67352 RepID=UPI00224F7BF9|nr:ATP-binding protein [Kitasatospora purpeofusca]MCX4755097.1 ATP-binding protein [Kitasatospora purpeofusca]WSR29494.1 ATP-binding protein [Kitasatospora purpeofusca]WSR37005.1 ATP-binding protein [Kitasatospora purpeofusca]